MGTSVAPSIRQMAYSKGSRTSISRSASPASSRAFTSAGAISRGVMDNLAAVYTGQRRETRKRDRHVTCPCYTQVLNRHFQWVLST